MPVRDRQVRTIRRTANPLTAVLSLAASLALVAGMTVIGGGAAFAADDATPLANLSFGPTSATAQTGAAVKMTIEGSVTSTDPVDQLVLVIPGSGSEDVFNFFELSGFTAITAPATTTWKAEVHVRNATWHTVASNLGDGDTADLASILTNIGPASSPTSGGVRM